ncbi:DUF2399 domain-containing protein [Chromobacterium amazonense]|uniref:DUF2399 domain-containing protein n=1 Tax=Chromobacterium amazonense TaxID=1382803 RepID=A0ABU8V5M0_9NEIS|nr:DUF2399 domain-containing protein [Chromobacterium amazonense]MDQ4539313.1 DUF2399 domain-containing protein [Chromobacterium amazonense]
MLLSDLDMSALVREESKGRDRLVPRPLPGALPLLGLDEAQWQTLRSWLKPTGASSKWTWMIENSQEKTERAWLHCESLLCRLLQAGWCELIRHAGKGAAQNHYLPYKVVWRDKEGLRRALGWSTQPEKEALQELWSQWQPRHPWLKDIAALCRKASMQVDTSRRRLRLLQGLDDWLGEERFGTERQFSQVVFQHTKALAKGDKEWLAESGLSLDACGISPHTPYFFLAANLDCYDEVGLLLRSSLLRKGSALPTESVLDIKRVAGLVREVRVVENFSVFQTFTQQVASGVSDAVVVWVPGQPHSRWRNAFSHLVSLCDAPVYVACDLDPAGVAIALQVGQLVEKQGRSWQPWSMQVDEDKLREGNWPLETLDRRHIQSLLQQSLPDDLRNLLEAMVRTGHKLEQEILFLE